MAKSWHVTSNKWDTTIKGGKLTKRQMTDEERAFYGLPLTGKAKVVAEMAAINAERMMDFGWGEDDELDRETTPWQPELQIIHTGAEYTGTLEY